MHDIFRDTNKVFKVLVKPDDYTDEKHVDINEDFEYEFEKVQHGLKDGASPESSPPQKKRRRLSLDIVPLRPDLDTNDMEKYLNKYLIYFKTVEKKVTDKTTELTHQNPKYEKLKELQKFEIELREFVERLDKFYVEINLPKDLEDHSKLKDILSCVKRLKKVLKRFENSNIGKILGETVSKKEEHILCSILGLNDKVAEYLIDINPEYKSYVESVEAIILEYFGKRDKTKNATSNTLETLQHLGFSSGRAKYLRDTLEIQTNSSLQTVLYWAEKYVEEEFKYNLLLGGKAQTSKQDQDFDVQYHTPGTFGEKPVQILTVNVQTPKDLSELLLEGKHPNLVKYLTQIDSTCSGTKYWFHATDHASVDSIIENGIELGFGKRFQDFSHGGGFYVTSDIVFALTWPVKLRKQDSAAILVFKMEERKSYLIKGKEIAEANEEWKKCIKYHRHGCNKKESGHTKQEAEELDDAPYIWGPLRRDGTDEEIEHRYRHPRFPKQNGNYQYQLCLKSKPLSRKFMQDIHEIIYIS